MDRAIEMRTAAVIDRSLVGRAFTPALVIAIAALVTRPLGPLAGTMLLVIVLPPLAASLDALGWAAIVAERVRGARLSATRQLLVAYGMWLAVSATLTLDVAAVVAVPVGLRLAARTDAGDDLDLDPAAGPGESDVPPAQVARTTVTPPAGAREGIALADEGAPGRHHLAAAILGSNVGSLLFPFSNLTNLIVVSATATPFAAYVAAAWAPQLLAAVAVGVLLVRRSPSPAVTDPPPTAGGPDRWLPRTDPTTSRPARAAILGGATAVIGALVAVVVGLAGGDVAPVFAIASAIVAGCAIGGDRAGTLGLAALGRSIPPSGIVIVLFAALAGGPIESLAAMLPDPQATLPAFIALPVIALVGGVLAATVNNLPAAAFGAIWLLGGSPDAVVAYLVGTNMLALATPHGSLATILSRRLADRDGVRIGTREYLLGGWRCAAAAGVSALVALLVVR
jgi:hypothetical protein